MDRHDSEDPPARRRVVALEIVGEETFGRGGFLSLRRFTLRNRRDDGSLSAPYPCDFVARDKGLDAVVVAVYRRRGDVLEVLLRDGLRPPLTLGRPDATQPMADPRAYLFLTEVVAGIIEASDRGEAGVRERAAIEVAEEAGFEVEAGAVEMLGAAPFPSPGALTERFFLAAVEVAEGAVAAPPPGDGSPMEEGATTRWLALDDAIAACVAGDIEDMKTELVLRRLRDHLGR